MMVPYGEGIFQKGSDKCNVGHSVELRRVHLEVSLEEPG